ncbi:hypothetical protein K435DRAFT_931873 [Dendrothele bispora CBS 962.96]|uniref:Uncharacterized protein n=1 Tax=Dendrothele bispora (strain CBS 962.96) TaxID=1314807 RepID=A0A4S8L3U2_DENBC|nr:hypothetical protein K435DRAFT_931873 [Dendrothele bispora CBS 962.96]
MSKAGVFDSMDHGTTSVVQLYDRSTDKISWYGLKTRPASSIATPKNARTKRQTSWPPHFLPQSYLKPLRHLHRHHSLRPPLPPQLLGLSPLKEEEDLVPTQPNTPAITPSHTFTSTTSTIVSQGLGLTHRLWREERRRLRDQMCQAQTAAQPRSAGPGDRNSTSSLAWSSASEDDFDPDPSDDFDDLEDDEDGWGSGRSGGGGGGWGFQFGKGRFSWGPSAFSSASNSNPSGAYPSQKDLARNFTGMEDSPATSVRKVPF